MRLEIFLTFFLRFLRLWGSFHYKHFSLKTSVFCAAPNCSGPIIFPLIHSETYPCSFELVMHVSYLKDRHFSGSPDKHLVFSQNFFSQLDHLLWTLRYSFSRYTIFKVFRGKGNYEITSIKLIISLSIKSKAHQNYYLAPIKQCLK